MLETIVIPVSLPGDPRPRPVTLTRGHGAWYSEGVVAVRYGRSELVHAAGIRVPEASVARHRAHRVDPSLDLPWYGTLPPRLAGWAHRPELGIAGDVPVGAVNVRHADRVSAARAAAAGTCAHPRAGSDHDHASRGAAAGRPLCADCGAPLPPAACRGHAGR